MDLVTSYPDGFPSPNFVCHTIAESGDDALSLSRPHRSHQIGLWLEGQGQAELCGEPLPEHRPTAWFLPAGSGATWHFEGRQEIWSVSFAWPDLHVASNGNGLVLNWLGVRRHDRRIKRADVHDSSRMVDVFRSLRNSMGRTGLTGLFESQSFMFLLIAFYVDLAEVDEAAGHRALLRFRELLEIRAFEDLSIEQLATEVGMSPEHMRDLFFKRYGSRPHRYRTTLRMIRARELLCTSNLIVKEVARQTGYADPLYFSRVFKSHFGISPSEMIHRHRGR